MPLKILPSIKIQNLGPPGCINASSIVEISQNMKQDTTEQVQDALTLIFFFFWGLSINFDSHGEISSCRIDHVFHSLEILPTP